MDLENDELEDDPPEPGEFTAEPEVEPPCGHYPSAPEWTLYALVAVWTRKPLPKYKPDGVEQYVAELVAAKPDIRLYRVLQQRLENSATYKPDERKP